MAYYGQQPMMGGGYPQQQGGMPMATVSGVDMNHDGIPDQLQGGGRMGMQPMMGGGMPMGAPMMGGMGYPQQQQSVMGAAYNAGLRPTDYNHNGVPDRMEGGAMGMMGKFLPDNNGNGIPDILEGRHRRY